MQLPTAYFPSPSAAGLRAHAPLMVSCLLLLALAVVSVRLVSAAVDWRHDARTTTGGALSPTATLPAATEANAVNIVESHLFGLPTAGMDVAATRAAPLFLVGTIAFEDPAAGFAIIGASAPTARFVRAGSAIVPGSLLVAVFSDRVMVDHDGQHEMVILPRELPPGMFVANVTDPAAGMNDAPSPVSLTLGGGGGRRRLNKRESAAKTQAMYDFPTELGNAAQVSAVIEAGELRGYKLEPGKSPAAFKALGMLSGDVVIAVNGYPVWHPEGRLALVNALLPGEQIEVSVARGTGWTDLTVDGKKLAGMTLTVETNPLLKRPVKTPRVTK